MQYMLMAGIGVLSDAVPDKDYLAEVRKRAADGQLAVLVVDHGGCFGANIPLSRVIITQEFAELASSATFEQGGGRLCRRGYSDVGELILPQAAVDKLFGGLVLGDTAPPSIEAINMNIAYLAAGTRSRT